jgi:tripartite-type tricarboxylate transporter receptor subunit TctC
MKRRDLLLGAGATIITGRASAAQDTFPDRPITITNGYGPGGSTDIAARLMIEQMPPNLGGNARLVVENRAGASGTLASAWMTRQPPDGYSLLISESSSFAIWPSMHESGTPYRPLQDFTWVATICTAPMVLLVKPDFPARNASEAFEVLRSDRSAQLDYSSSGAGSIPHIAAEMLKYALGKGALSQNIPYRGGAAAVLSIAKGETAWGVASLGSAAGQMQGNLVRPLAVTGATRFPTFPDVPTFAEVGLRDMELDIFYLLSGPAGLPAEIYARLNRASVAALTHPQTRERFLGAGMQAWNAENTPESARRVVEAELARFRSIGERTGIKITGG